MGSEEMRDDWKDWGIYNAVIPHSKAAVWILAAY